MEYRIETKDGIHYVASDYSGVFREQAKKQLSGQWKDGNWVFENCTREQVAALCLECYGESEIEMLEIDQRYYQKGLSEVTAKIERLKSDDKKQQVRSEPISSGRPALGFGD